MQLSEIFRFIETHKQFYIESLAEAVSIPSVSSEEEHQADVVRMLKWTEQKFKALGAITEVCPFPSNEEEPERPSVLLASISSPLCKRTLLVYCHVDVAAVDCPENWSGDPFVLAEMSDETLRGRGTIQSKGPLLCWLSALHALRKLGQEAFCQLKFVVDSALHMNSPRLEDFLLQKRNTFLKDVDLVCVSYGSWLGERTPCIVYGLRGLCYFQVEVAGCNYILHGRESQRLAREPMLDLLYLMNSLQNDNGLPSIPGLSEDVEPITPEEESLYETVDLQSDGMRGRTSWNKERYQDRLAMLNHSCRYPSLSYHGIDVVDTIDSTGHVCRNIPQQVMGRFSIRIVPNQNPNKVIDIVLGYLMRQWTHRRSPNCLFLQTMASIRPWLEDPRSPHYEAVRRATRRVYQIEPDMVRDGASLPVVMTLQRVMDRSLVLLSTGAGVYDEDTEERCHTNHFVEGIKIVIAYMHEVSQL